MTTLRVVLGPENDETIDYPNAQAKIENVGLGILHVRQDVPGVGWTTVISYNLVGVLSWQMVDAAPIANKKK